MYDQREFDVEAYKLKIRKIGNEMEYILVAMEGIGNYLDYHASKGVASSRSCRVRCISLRSAHA
jgi:hypothetical protein